MPNVELVQSRFDLPFAEAQRGFFIAQGETVEDIAQTIRVWCAPLVHKYARRSKSLTTYANLKLPLCSAAYPSYA